ncbi:MAG TPA: TIGR02206 family membrane protein [Anaerolineales bacterium]|nr:TIGR02206 family membrane protein [Anaerolineales bacterium]
MGSFFARDFLGPPFMLFGAAHLAALGVLVLLNIFLLRFRGSPEDTRRKVRWTLALVLWCTEASWNLWVYLTGQWTVQWMLPLNLCTVLIWLTGFMLIFKNQIIYEFCYFLGIGAGIQYLMTPDLATYGFGSYRFFETFTSHGLLVTSAIYMTVVEGFRPTWKSLLRVFVVGNLYLLLMYFVNLGLHSNYLDVNGKPPTASIFDLLPPWPYYILYIELIAIITFLLLYLPFAIRDRRASARTAQA